MKHALQSIEPEDAELERLDDVLPSLLLRFGIGSVCTRAQPRLRNPSNLTLVKSLNVRLLPLPVLRLAYEDFKVSLCN